MRRVPARPRGHLPQAPILSAEAHDRLRCLEHADRASAREAAHGFVVPVSTISRWRQRFRPDDLATLEPRSRRPHRTRHANWTAAREQAVRERHPRMGKGPLRVLLAQQGAHLSASMIGWILSSLRRRRLLREPHAVRVRRERSQRPYATRVPPDKRTPNEPGALIQLDTMHLRPLPGVERRQFTAIDVISRTAVVGVRATAGTATAFLDELAARMPVPVHRRNRVDGGSGFMAGFEAACRAKGIVLYVLPPPSPKLSGRVERLNGTARREFWERYDGDLDLSARQAAVRAWDVTYDNVRPHQALGYAPPPPSSPPSRSHMYRTNTSG